MIQNLLSQNLSSEISIDNFMPIACHYNEDTLLTKNGQLIQTIKINGLGYQNLSKELLNLKQHINDTLKKYLDNENIACWINNIRDQNNIDDTDESDNFLAYNIHNMWQEQNSLNSKYVNVLYISFVYKAQVFNSKSIQGFIDHFSFVKTTLAHDDYLHEAHDILANLVNIFLRELIEFNPKKLQIILEKDTYISENLQLYDRLITQANNVVPIDTSGCYARYKEYNYQLSDYVLRMKKNEDVINFIVVFSLKDYQDAPLSILIDMLHLPIKITISEIFYPSIKSKAIEDAKYQSYVLGVSKDNSLVERFKINDFINPKGDRSNNFFERQVSMTISCETEEQLQENLHMLSLKLDAVGIVHVVEDVLLENSLWGQLPGNFQHLKRTFYTNINYIPAFASLYAYDIGRITNAFGSSLSILNTEKNNPYYFNIHDDQDRGLMCMIGKNRSGKTLITNFLVSEAMKYDPQILYITTNSDARVLVEGLGGEWLESFKINPFITDNVSSDRELKNFCKILTTVKEISDVQLAERQELLDVVTKLPTKKRTIENILKKLDNNLSRKLKFLLDNEDYTNFFTDEDDVEDTLTRDIICFDISKLTEDYFYNKYYAAAQLPKEREVFSANLELNNNVKTLVLSHIFKSFFNVTDDEGRLKILVIDDALNSLNNIEFDDFYEDSKDFIERKNIIISNIDSNNLDNVISPAIQSIINNCNTKILLPGEKLPNTFAEILNISLDKLLILNRIAEESGLFFVEQNNNVNILGLDLYRLKFVMRILSADEEVMAMFHELKKKKLDIRNIIAEIYQKFNI